MFPPIMPPSRRHYALRIAGILLLAAALYLVGNNTVSLWDRDEPRYAQTSRQMLESGDWVVPRILDEVRIKKPIFIYWCQAFSMKCFGTNEFAARLPSVVAMLLTLGMLSLVLPRAVGRRRALWTTLILATSALAIAAAKMCLTDSVLLLFITAAQLCLAGLYLRRPTRLAQRYAIAVPMWIAFALAVLTKGPVVLGVQLATMLVLLIFDWKSLGAWWWRRTSPLVGIVIVVAICLPWAYLIHQREPSFFSTILQNEVINRARSGQEGHKGPPGYYLLTVWGTFFPWSLLLPAVIVHAWKRRRVPVIRFALAAIIGPWVMFELIQTKLPHYVLPTYPALAFLSADFLLSAARRARQWTAASGTKSPPFADRAFIAIVSCWALIVLLIATAPWAGLLLFNAPTAPGLVAMIILPILALIYGVLVVRRFREARPLAAAATMGIGAAVLIGVLYGGYFPYAQYLRISPQLANVLVREQARIPGDAIMIEYKEMSLAFYQGGTIRPQSDNKFLEKTPPEQWPRYIVAPREIYRTAPRERQEQLYILTEVHGLNYADGGKIQDVLVLRKR
jgi:4-amino-4-deoxy-L-arabinose transferase-like glycosyltransferase